MDWLEIAGTIIGGAVLIWLRSLHARLNGKADKKDFETLRQWMEKRDEKADESRSRLHTKLDQSITTTNDVAQRVARLEGRANGVRGDG